MKTKQGAYLPCLSNAILILANADEWLNVLAYDSFAGTIVKKKRPPIVKSTEAAPGSEGDSIDVDWTHEDSLRAATWLSTEWGCPFSVSTVDEAVRAVADRWQVHPVRDYLNGVVGQRPDGTKGWDRKPRLDTLLIRVAGAEDNLYTRHVTKNFFLGAVSRIMHPGSHVDTVLILEGNQGLGKSTLLRNLAEPWFMDTLFNLGSKDGYQVLRRKWIIEFSELDSLSRSDLARAKAFISSPKDTYRASYGRTATDFPRQCVFTGTVNPNGAGYLNDPTGARRFWPVKLTKHVDHATVRAEKDQLWAEAYTRYKNNEKWHLRDPALLKAAAAEAEARREPHSWEEYFRKWLSRNDRQEKGVTLEELLTKAAEVPKGQQDRDKQITGGKALRAIGWTIVKRGTDGSRRYFPENPQPPIPPKENRDLSMGKRGRGRGKASGGLSKTQFSFGGIGGRR